MNILATKRGSAVGYILAGLFVLFLMAFIFVMLYPVFFGLDNFVTPMLSGAWLNGLANWRTMIWWSPVPAFLLLLGFIIYKIANENSDQQLNP